MKIKLLLFFIIPVFIAACSASRNPVTRKEETIVTDSVFVNAHIGISLFDVAENKYLYNYQGDKYFVPASNIKIVTCYAALKYLGDSLPGIRYFENDTALYLLPTGDPGLLHSEFSENPVIGFLQKTNKHLYITGDNWKEKALGFGWSWDDYNDNYMVERSPLPVYGNILHWVQEKNETAGEDNPFGNPVSIYSIPEVNWRVRFNTQPTQKSFYVERNRDDNVYIITEGTEKKKEQDVPFVTNGLQSALELLPDTVGKEIRLLPDGSRLPATGSRLQTIYSRSTDSLLKPMMHRSDNFYAEQVLLMVSNELLGEMNDRAVIDTLLKTALNDLPQKPRWVDGSGLSRYNLFTPQDFVTILNKMQREFGMERLKTIFATGSRGTLSNYYKQDSGYIYAKTGTLSGVVSLSGFLYTRKNKLLVFSVLVNNHHGSATAIRRRVEIFLSDIRARY